MAEGENLDDFIAWLNVLEPKKTATPENVFIGRSIAEALHKIDAAFFDVDFLDRVPNYSQDVSWPLKKNNLHKIYFRLSEFYKDRLEVTLPDEWMIDFRSEAEETIAASVSRLLKLVLAASLLNTRNQKYFISVMIQQSKELQFTAMSTVQEIKELMPETSQGIKKSDFSSSTAVPPSVDSEETVLKAKFERITKENQRLLQQVKDLKEERDQLVEQNKTYRGELEVLGGSSTEAENLRRQLRASQTIKENIQDSLYKMEAERDHYRRTAEEVAKENAALADKLQRLTPLEEECRKAKDELEECRLRKLEFEKLNSQVEVYKAKLKDYNSQKIEMKVMEEKLGTYMQSLIALEDEQRKNGVLKTQIESLRLQNNDLSEKLREENRRADKAEFEANRLSDRLREIENLKEELKEEYRQMNEKLFLHRENLASKVSVSSLHDETLEANSFSFQEQGIKLGKENELLQAKESQQLILVKEELSVLAEKKAELESELKWSQRQVLELEAKLKDAEESLAKDGDVIENRFSEQQAVKEKLALNVAQLEARLEQSNKNYELLSDEKEKLKVELELTKQELSSEKENLKNYMEKARRIIDDVEKQNHAVEGGALSRHEFDAIRRERDSYKQTAEAQRVTIDRTRAMQEEEQRLITSHFYNMMMQMQLSNRMEDSARSDVLSASEKSFLARQRQCSNFSSLLFFILFSLAFAFFLWNFTKVWSSICCEENELPPF